MTATVGQHLERAAVRLAGAGIHTARLDARLLLGDVLGERPQTLAFHPERLVSDAQAATFLAMIARREDREPVSHILGRRGFWTLDLTVSRHVLDPRPDTETLVQAVLDHVTDRRAPLRLLDLGTGSGCILLALLSELPAATGLGIDRSPEALAVAGANAIRCGLDRRTRFRAGDWGSGLDERFDMVVSNPPYIPDGDIDALEPEVARHEPRLALAGGPDGLDCYRTIAAQARDLLVPGGLLALEVGAGQAGPVAALAAAAGLGRLDRRRDLGGIERCILAFT